MAKRKRTNNDLHGKCSTTSEYLFCGARETVPYEAQFHSCLFDTEDVVKKAVEELKSKNLIPDYAKHEKKILEVLKNAAQTEATLTTKMSDMINKNTIPQVEQEMKAIIGQQRVVLIKQSFDIETCRMKLVNKPHGQLAVQVYRGGAPCQPERMLSSTEDTEYVSALQWTSLVLEIFIFQLNCAGIVVEIKAPNMEKLLKKIELILQGLEFANALNKFIAAWIKAGHDVWEKAKAIFAFLDDIFFLGIFWMIINLIFEHMSIMDMIIALAEVALIIIAAFTTGGVALIARIGVAVDGAYHLKEKIVNLVKFSDKKKTFE